MTALFRADTNPRWLCVLLTAAPLAFAALLVWTYPPARPAAPAAVAAR